MPVTGNDKNIDLSKLGFTEVQTHDDDLSKFGFTEVKKKVGGNGQLQSSNPSVSIPQSTSKSGYDISQNVPEFHVGAAPKNPFNAANNFGMPTGNNASNPSVPDNTGISKSQTVNTQDLGFQKAADKKLEKQNEDFKNKAIDNTVQESLKLKGINAQKGSLLYNIEKSTYTKQLDDGNAA